MASTEPEKCFTCFRRTDNFIRITKQDGVSGEDLQEIFAKHFWFTNDQLHNKPVCTTCYERIDDFHRFYCDVAKMHSAELLEVKVELVDEVENDPAAKMDVEEESDELGSDVFAEALCKVEHAKDVAHCSDEEDDDDDEDYADLKDKKGSDSESDVPLAKRKVTRKSQKQQRRQKKTDLKKGDSFSFSCQLCVDAGVENAKSFATFYKLSKHFGEVHKSPPFVMCCGRKFTSRRGLAHHSKKHPNASNKPNINNPSKHCVECNVYFRKEEGLAKHMFLIHTPEDQKQFKCDLCLKAFADEELLRIHVNWHFQVQQKNHYCAECDQYFISAFHLQRHNEKQHQSPPPVVTHPDPDDDASNDSDQSESKVKGTPESVAKEEEIIHKVLTLKCSECNAVVDTFQLLKRHGREAHGLRSMTIICCDRRFGRRSYLYEHCLVHLKPDAFECEHCKKRFSASYALQLHKWWIHTPASERPFKCDICGNTFMKENLLKQHIQRHVEQERKVFQCQQCDRALCSAVQLKAHMQALHGEAFDWVCDVCAKGFSSRSEMERHAPTHTAEGLAKMMEQCTNCNKWYSNHKSYIRHRRRCGETQPVKCNQCDHTAVNDIALKTHMKLRHTDRPKYPCTYCGKEFSREIRLKEHEANHAGVFLYKCEFCPRTCNSSSNMYTHKKVAHPEQWAQKVAARFGPPPTFPQ